MDYDCKTCPARHFPDVDQTHPWCPWASFKGSVPAPHHYDMCYEHYKRITEFRKNTENNPE